MTVYIYSLSGNSQIKTWLYFMLNLEFIYIYFKAENTNTMKLTWPFPVNTVAVKNPLWFAQGWYNPKDFNCCLYCSQYICKCQALLGQVRPSCLTIFLCLGSCLQSYGFPMPISSIWFGLTGYIPKQQSLTQARFLFFHLHYFLKEAKGLIFYDIYDDGNDFFLFYF